MKYVWLFLFFVLGCAPVRPQHTVKLQYDNILHTSPGAPIHWSSRAFPLNVLIDQDVSEPIKSGVYQAVGFWNLSLGTEVFSVQVIPHDHDAMKVPSFPGNVVVTMDDVRSWHENKRAWAVVKHYLRPPERVVGRSFSSYVLVDFSIERETELRNWSMTETAFRVLLHEFGHVLGLAHDEDDEDSLMFPVIDPTTDPALFALRDLDRWYVRHQLDGTIDANLQTKEATCLDDSCLTQPAP